MNRVQLSGSALLRGVLAGVVALLVVYGVLFLTAAERSVTATATCENGAAVTNPTGNPGLVGDCAVLLAVKDTLRGSDPLNWSADLVITSWEGITVSGTPGRVTRLDLNGNTSGRLWGRQITLTGTIPPELGELSKLTRLVLSRHELTGTIPPELGNLSELTALQLNGNNLTGGIPAELGNLSSLTTLNLRTNPLAGSIPVELGKLTNLVALYLENGQLTGSIPASLGDLPSLAILKLYGNTTLSGCIPASLRGITLNDLSSLNLSYCTTTTTYSLTTTATGKGRISPLPGTYSYLSGASVTVTATPDEGYRVASWGDHCSTRGTATTCALTMDADRTASVTFERITYTLTVTAGEGGSVTPEGTTTHGQGSEVALTASWNDATHTFSGWGGDCSGTSTTCVLTMDAAKTVTASYTALPATRCATRTASDCIRAVYLGAPGDYAQVQDIPADLLLIPNSDGRYYVERGQQVTVVTAAPLPEGWTRFYLEQTPLGTPSPVSFSQLIKPVGTTYTFTPTTDPAGATLITFDLKRARPFVRPRPDGKPEIGNTVVTTVFSVVNCESGVAVSDPGTNSELVEDCESLLKARDRLAGTATLNWSAGRPMAQWTGVTVAGTPQRVTKLELASSGLTGELTGPLGNLTGLTHLRLNRNTLTGRIPSKLSLLTRLTHVYLAGNSFSGCLPSAWSALSTTNDFQAATLRYCESPESVHDHRNLIDLEGGQAVSYQLYDNGPTLTVDLPAGYTYQMRSVTGEPPPGLPSRLIVVSVFDEEGKGSWISLDPDTGREYYRYIQGWGGLTYDGRRVGTPADGGARSDSSGGDGNSVTPADALIEVFNTIAESAWIQE